MLQVPGYYKFLLNQYQLQTTTKQQFYFLQKCEIEEKQNINFVTEPLSKF